MVHTTYCCGFKLKINVNFMKIRDFFVKNPEILIYVADGWKKFKREINFAPL
jgi:hypothetical protein